jgi:hypothetical protein
MLFLDKGARPKFRANNEIKLLVNLKSSATPLCS